MDRAAGEWDAGDRGADEGVLFDLALAHGRAVGLAIPEGHGDALAALAARLHPDERALSAPWSPARQRTWLAGRAALRLALARHGVDLAAVPAVLPDDRGAPVLPPGVLASLSHKEHVAVALIDVAGANPAPLAARTYLGVDVELDPRPDEDDEDDARARPGRVDISRRVLSPAELPELDGLSLADRAREVLLRFSAKEALYKALDPFVRRYVGFHEVAVRPEPGGACRVTLHLPDGAGLQAEVRWLRRGGLVLTTARVIGPPR